MSVISLLPDPIANQIAAGEVVQRPASAVKELLENSVDAESTKIQLIIKDGGKSLIQVIDNGKGMSPTDARMCWERHATSKIKKIEDLFALNTMGFRGEALASIAAIAQVEMKTRREQDELGTLIFIEGSEVRKQEPVSYTAGTSISVKNLFFNVPARRNFLKSDSVETNHVVEEFTRVALANPHIGFVFINNESETFHLLPGTLKQRIIGLFGEKYKENLLTVNEHTGIANIYGFAGKPESAKRTRGDQYFFVNRRFIKNAYLNHAMVGAYQDLMPTENYPFYVIFIDIDPAKIDINVHPTKTEIKFEDEKSLYTILKAVVKKSLGQFTISPQLDFDQPKELQQFVPAFLPEGYLPPPPEIRVDKSYNPFSSKSQEITQKHTNKNDWEKLFEVIKQTPDSENNTLELLVEKEEISSRKIIQLHNRFILSQIKTGLMIVDQQAAHERILYERFVENMEKHNGLSQQLLFPRSISLSVADYVLVGELEKDFKAIGFVIDDFGNNTVVVNGLPADVQNMDEQKLLEELLEQYKHYKTDVRLDRREILAKAMAKKVSIKAGRSLSDSEMSTLIDELFGCAMPYRSIDGKSTVITMSLEELIRKF